MDQRTEGNDNRNLIQPITTRLAQRLLGTPLIRNDIRGELVEEMVAVALEPE